MDIWENSNNFKKNIINLDEQISLSNKEYLELISHKLISQEIYIKYKLKNFLLLKQIIYLISKITRLVSVRELHSILEKNNIKISQITLLDYIDYMINSNLIKKVFRYDMKKNNTSTWKAKYLFLNTWIRYALSDFNLTKSIINENLVYSRLLEKWQTIVTWKNWTFDFSFISNNNITHVSHNLEKKEVIKEARKLLKISWDFEKFLIVNSIKKLSIRPSTYLPLKIMEIEEYLEL